MDSVHSSIACLPTCLIVIRIGYFQKFQKSFAAHLRISRGTQGENHWYKVYRPYIPRSRSVISCRSAVAPHRSSGI